MKMPNNALSFAQSIIVDLDLDKVALVNQGANSRANILLTKRKENNTMPETFEKLMEALTEEQATLVKTHIAAIEKTHTEAIATADTTIATLNADLTKAKEEVEVNKSKADVKSPEDMLKSVSPEIANYVAELQKSVKGLVATQEEALAKSRFEAVKAIPCEEEELKSVLKSASPAVYDILLKAAKAVEENVLKAKGTDNPEDTFKGGADEAYGKLEKSARAIMVEDVSKTFEGAFMDACSRDPKTYATYVKEAK
jgi:septum formation inhibitor-activating ATPase MinD